MRCYKFTHLNAASSMFAKHRRNSIVSDHWAYLVLLYKSKKLGRVCTTRSVEVTFKCKGFEAIDKAYQLMEAYIDRKTRYSVYLKLKRGHTMILN